MSVLIIVDDLFFSAKIGETARQTGANTVLTADPDNLSDLIQAERPKLMIVDLGLMKTDAVALIGKMKQNPVTQDIRMIAFGSHIDHALMNRAVEAGCDEVMPRSAFTRRLPEILGSTPA